MTSRRTHSNSLPATSNPMESSMSGNPPTIGTTFTLPPPPRALPTTSINHQHLSITQQHKEPFVPQTQQLFTSSNEQVDKFIKSTFLAEHNGLTKMIGFLQNMCNYEESFQQKILNECSNNNFDSYFNGQIGSALVSCRSFYYKNAKTGERFSKDVRHCICDPLQQLQKEITKKKKIITQTHENVLKSHQNALSQLQSKRKTFDQKKQSLENAERKWKNSLKEQATERTTRSDSIAGSFFNTLSALANDQTKSKYEQSLEEYSESELALQQAQQRYDTLVKKTLHPQFSAISQKVSEQHAETVSLVNVYLQHLTSLFEAKVEEAKNNLASFKQIVDSINLEEMVALQHVAEDEEQRKKKESPQSEKPHDCIITHSNSSVFTVYSQEKDENTIFFDNVLNEIMKRDDLKEQESTSTNPITTDSSDESLDRRKSRKLSENDNYYLNMLDSCRKKLEESADCRISFCKVLNQRRTKSKFSTFVYFQDFAELVGLCLTLAHDNTDQNVGRLLLNMTQTFYYYGSDLPLLDECVSSNPKEKKKIFVYSLLDDLECWQDLRFWEFCLYDALNTEKLNRQTDNRTDDQQARSEHENIVFGLLSSFCFTMNEMAVSPRIIRQFAEKMCTINDLNDDYKMMIMSTIENNDSLNEIYEDSKREKMSKYRSKRMGVIMGHDSESRELDLLRLKIQLESTKINSEYFTPKNEDTKQEEKEIITSSQEVIEQQHEVESEVQPATNTDDNVQASITDQALNKESE